jgi:uncharacterized protein (DUF58 family)
MIFRLLMPIDTPLVVPINMAPLLGQMEMERLHVLGAFLIVLFVIATSVIGWKIMRATVARPLEDHRGVDRRDLDQAA